MPRSRQSARRSCISELIRRYNTPGFYHSLLGTTDRVHCEALDHLSPSHCPFYVQLSSVDHADELRASNVVNHADNAPAVYSDISDASDAETVILDWDRSQIIEGTPYRTSQDYRSPVSDSSCSSSGKCCSKWLNRRSTAGALPDFSPKEENLVKIRSDRILTKRLTYRIVEWRYPSHPKRRPVCVSCKK